MDDPTNFDPTYAMRNAIRNIVANQNNLPVALCKDRLIQLSTIGREYREYLLKEVNGILRRCTFKRDTFTGSIQVKIPDDLYEQPHRVLRHFIPALTRIFWARKVREFAFLGIEGDISSKQVLTNFLNPKYKRFNVQGVMFDKRTNKEQNEFSIVLYPEEPRRRSKKPVVYLKVENQEGAEWKRATFEFPMNWRQPWPLEVLVREDRNYYFRRLHPDDERFVGKFINRRQKMYYRHALKRSRFYCRELFPVLCHMEGHREWVDSVPQFRIDIVPDVKTVSYGVFDLKDSYSQWNEMQWEETKIPLEK